MRRRNGRGKRRGRCLKIFTSPFHLVPPGHTATGYADQEAGSRGTSGHMTNVWKASSSFRGIVDDNEDDMIRKVSCFRYLINKNKHVWNSHQWPVVAQRASNQTNSLEYVLFRKELPQVWIDCVDFLECIVMALL